MSSQQAVDRLLHRRSDLQALINELRSRRQDVQAAPSLSGDAQQLQTALARAKVNSENVLFIS